DGVLGVDLGLRPRCVRQPGCRHHDERPHLALHSDPPRAIADALGALVCTRHAAARTAKPLVNSSRARNCALTGPRARAAPASGARPVTPRADAVNGSWTLLAPRLEPVLRQQAVDVDARHAGGARGRRDLAAVAQEQVLEVAALERVEGAAARRREG